MSSEAVEVSPEARAKDDEFLEDVRSGKVNRRLRRHGKLARFTHGCCAICCILLVISGLFTFIPPLTELAGQDVVYAMRMSHRVIGCVFIIVPIIALFAAPKKAAAIAKELFAKWDSDDRKWMLLFFPYLFMCKWIHMPDQHEEKSGQRFADGVVWLACFIMGISGFLLLLGSSGGVDFGEAYGVILTFHDLGFLLIAVFGLAHIFLGSGIFQPYRGCANLMWGDGTTSEADALYHWGHWARAELAGGETLLTGEEAAKSVAKAQAKADKQAAKAAKKAERKAAKEGK